MDRLTFEAALLFFRMRVAAKQFLGQGELSAGRRSLIKSLGAHGPQTVPQMARVRSVSRQHIQTLVNSLREDGLVHSVENPSHLRSVLIELTPKGRRFLAEMESREVVLRRFLARGIPAENLQVALEVVQALRGKFESEEWDRLAKRARQKK
ncbi:MAG: MarR family transcriptional regulator [Gemmatimonadota bacterium]|nr:MAG: MarR family transcriptional regulator [Gemmatimonadota bacterium]